MHARISALAVAFCLLTGCNTSPDATGSAPGATGTAKGAQPASQKTGEASGTKVEELPLVAELPAGVTANAMGVGFHAEDESVHVMIKATGDGDAKDFAAAKKSTEEILFKKWVKSEKTADGWVLVWLSTGMDMDGKEYENSSFAVRRKIGDVSYECYGAVKKPANIEKNIKICQSLKAG